MLATKPLAMRILERVPLALTLLRALLAPVIAVLAVFYPNNFAFGLCLVIGFLSDVFDGIIARRLNVATVTLRRLDSVADSMFYIAAMFAAWRLHESQIREYIAPLIVLLTLELARYVFDYAKFKREASYHMWSSKFWGLTLFVGFFVLLAFGIGGWPIALAIYTGIFADVEVSPSLSLCENGKQMFLLYFMHSRYGKLGPSPATICRFTGLGLNSH